jgi:hypothetical protein
MPGQSTKKASVSKFTKFAADLGFAPLPADAPAPAPVATKTKVKPAKKVKTKPVVQKDEPAENLVDEVVEITD